MARRSVALAAALAVAVAADVAITNGGGIRTNALFPAGAIRRRDVFAWLPFGNLVVKVALTGAALRQALETAVMTAELEEHYRRHPNARPSLAEVALALAAQDGSPLADRPELLQRAAEEVVKRRPDADPDDVLLWAEAQQAALA